MYGHVTRHGFMVDFRQLGLPIGTYERRDIWVLPSVPMEVLLLFSLDIRLIYSYASRNMASRDGPACASRLVADIS